MEPDSSNATTPSGPTITSARCGKPPGWYTPKARQAAPLGSKSDSCWMLTPSFSRNAVCDQLASQETPYMVAPRLGR